MKESLPVVKRAVAAVSAIGGTPAIRAAKWRARRELDGPPRCSDRDLRRRTEQPHTIDEWINLDEYDRTCALAVQLATMP
jgi:tripeptide aminopeptidase